MTPLEVDRGQPSGQYLRSPDRNTSRFRGYGYGSLVVVLGVGSYPGGGDFPGGCPRSTNELSPAAYAV